MKDSSVYSAYRDGEWRLYWVEDDALVLACGRCGVQWFDDWHVPDEVWEAGRHGYDALCRPCWDLLRQQAVIEAAQRFMDAADLSRAVIPEPPSEWRTDFYAYHDARHDLYQALATLTQEEPDE